MAAVAWEGEQVNLSRLPLPRHFAVDAAPWITAWQTVACGPEKALCILTLHPRVSRHRSRTPILARLIEDALPRAPEL